MTASAAGTATRLPGRPWSASRLAAAFAPRMLAATLGTGVAAGLAGVVLVWLLHGVQHVSFGYTENTFLVGVERASSARRVLALTIGGVIVGVGWWAHRRRFPHSPSVTGALRGSHGLPFMATTSDAVLQVVAVGAGASLGREGAPRQVGAAIAQLLARRLGVPASQQRTLLACGAGAGFAAVYNVPFGGAVFTLEILLASAALDDVIAAALTASIATIVAWPFLGREPTYHLPPPALSLSLCVWALLFGPVAGACGHGFARVSTFARERAPHGAFGAVTITVVFAALGAAAIAYPQLLGNGKGMAQLTFAGGVGVGLAAALLIAKPAATVACLGAGAIGGLLTPALATGAVLGVLAGDGWTQLWPGAAPAAYALVGAAALLAASQHAALTAVVLVADFTHAAQHIVLPLVIAVAGAAVTARLVARHRRPASAPAVVVDVEAEPVEPGGLGVAEVGQAEDVLDRGEQ